MKPAVLTASLLAFVVASGCTAVAETTSKMAEAMPTASSADPIAEAKMTFEEASKVGCAWRDTQKMIDKAEALAADGKSDEAAALAQKATRQSQNGMAQCASEAKRLSTL